MTILPIPIAKRSSNLKPLLAGMLQRIHELRQTELLKTSSYALSLYSIIFPWFVQDELKTEESETAKRTFIEFGVDGSEFGKKLEAVLDDDPHLRECCVSPMLFARLLDGFIDRSIDDIETSSPTSDRFDSDFEEFAERVYEEPFRAFAFSHVFNFSAFAEHLNFGNLNIRKISTLEIPFLLGESTSFSFLHPFQSGEFFVVAESDSIIDNDLLWMRNCHESAEQLVRVFQYYKDGVVHLNYTANFFRPLWLNTIRKNGMLYWGDNRRLSYEQGKNMFYLNPHEYAQLENWWTIFSKPDIVAKFGDERNALGKMLDFAGGYYESSQTQTEINRKLIDLSIALESAFSPGNQNEVSFQLSQLAAEFVGSTPEEKHEIFAFVKKMYGKRSNLLHGNPKADDIEYVTISETERFSSIIRRGLLKFVALYVDGEADHKAIIKQIRAGMFDPKVRETLSLKADINRVINMRE